MDSNFYELLQFAGRLLFVLLLLGTVLCEQNKAPDAEPLLRETLKIRGKTATWNKFLIADAQSHLGRALTMQREFEEAEQLLLAASAQFKDASPAWEKQRQFSYGHTVGLYKSWGKPDKAAKWSPKLGSMVATSQPAPVPAGSTPTSRLAR